MKKSTFIILTLSFLFLSSCGFIQIIPIESQQPSSQSEQPKRKGKVIRKEKKENPSSKTEVNNDNGLYKELNLSPGQIKKYETIKDKYKTKASIIIKDKNKNRSVKRQALIENNNQQNNELKSIFSASQFEKYSNLMNNNLDKRKKG